MKNQTDSLTIERYELKYLIPKDLVPFIIDYIAPYCEMDPYSQKSEDHYYRVNSLYLDTDSHLFYRKRIEGCEKRFNMRIRSYGEVIKPPYFYEVKLKARGYLRKYRAMHHSGDLDAFINDEESSPNADLFKRLAISYNVQPVLQTSYKRCAFFSKVDDYARVTFDKDLSYFELDDENLPFAETNLLPYDQEALFPQPESVVCELKSTYFLPLWMLDLIKTFELKRMAFSKYASSLAKYIEEPHNELSYLDSNFR